ncbi:MAG: hypothetical protein K2H18_03540 [Muribaculaceae bacterium]|nr:hypothetical protein [Muribaculaceae bacterium]
MKAIFLFSVLFAVMAQAQERINVTVDGVTRTILLSDSEAAKELKNRLSDGNVTVKMNDYGGFEKVGELPWSLPTSNRQISTVPGDVMLYLGNNIVIFYGTNSWSYTPLGKIEGATADEIQDFLGEGQVDAILSVDIQSGVSEVNTDYNEDNVYSLQGTKIDMRGRTPADLPTGIYIINGKKQLIK